ncbi:MAG: hypothetical protein HY741_28460 [Chloroflexi bacterium]|nr:hypothetical protein [Chloroflexota bacterium]
MEGLKPCQFRQVDNHGRILCNLTKGGDREVSVNLCRACPVQAINCQNLRAGLEKKVSTPITVRFATGRVEVWDDAPPGIDFKQAACAAKTMPIHSPRDCAGCPLRIPNVVPQNAIQVARQSKQNAPVPTVSTSAQTSIVPPTAAPRAQRVASTTAAQSLSQRATAKRAPAVARTDPASTANHANAPRGRSNAATDLIARAKATAQKKAAEQAEIAKAAQRVAAEERVTYAPTPEPKSKIIQIQEWLAGQVTRKQTHQPLPVTPDADGVSEIVYAPLGAQTAQAHQETVDYERCVGWTD